MVLIASLAAEIRNLKKYVSTLFCRRLESENISFGKKFSRTSTFALLISCDTFNHIGTAENSKVYYNIEMLQLYVNGNGELILGIQIGIITEYIIRPLSLLYYEVTRLSEKEDACLLRFSILKYLIYN